ncbi:MAG: hypothetical protein ACI36W_06455 [Coriobacteriales bacterium]
MQVFISHQSALQYWRNTQTTPTAERVSMAQDHTPKLCANEATWLQETWGIRQPVHVCVPGKRAVRHPSTLHCHVQDRTPSYTGFCHLGKSTFVASPELALIQLASHLGRSKLLHAEKLPAKCMQKKAPIIVMAILLCELMGSYRLSPNADGFKPAQVLLDRSRIAHLLGHNPELPGHAVLSSALGFAFEGSASPAETALALFETLPLSYGGMGLAERPVLNTAVSVHHNQHVATRFPDQLFKNHAWVLEYNGSYHEGERANKDDLRRIELENAGYSVKTINRDQLLSPSELDSALAPLVSMIGTVGRRPANYEDRRRDMRALVFETGGTRHPENRRELLSGELLP